MYFFIRSPSPARHRKVFKCCASFLSTINKPKRDTTTDWNGAITEAEKIVGYPTSFLNLRWLLNDEVANVAMHIRKLIGTDHPLLRTAKNMLLHNESPSWGLIVLLVSKAAGHEKEFSAVDKDVTAGVLHSQRILSEVTEMIRNSHMLHKALTNIDSSTVNVTDMNFGNKIALLSGDYLLSTSYNELARIKNHELNELMSSALRDLAEGEFIGPRDGQNRPLPAKPQPTIKAVEIPDEFTTKPLKTDGILGNAQAEWTLRNILGGASLLGKSCQGSLKLAGHSDEFQRTGFVFGKYFALAVQAFKEMESVRGGNTFSLVSAPVLFHLQQDASLYAEIELMVDSDCDVDHERLRDLINCGTGLEKSKKLQHDHYLVAVEALNKFPRCDSVAVLRNILDGTQH